jgi:hypothetical protein
MGSLGSEAGPGLRYQTDELRRHDRQRTCGAVGISCLSITSEREERVDFSHSFFETHKAIGIKKARYLSSIRQFLLSPRILTAIIIVLGAAALLGGVF